MSVIKEFKSFALKGNVIELAVAVVVGSSFNAIVNSIVGDIVMPTIGIVTGNINFSDLVFELHYLPGKISRFHKKNWQKAKALIALTRFIKEGLVKRGLPADKILVAGDAVDLEEFSLAACAAQLFLNLIRLIIP